jgi:hypothetical protein
VFTVPVTLTLPKGPGGGDPGTPQGRVGLWRRISAWLARPGRLVTRITWPRLRWPWELLTLVIADVVYELIRAAAPQHAVEAFRHAALISDLEPLVVRTSESWLRELTRLNPALSTGFEAYYTDLHLLVTGGVLAWLWWRRPGGYARARTVLFVLTFGALVVFWVFPVAPPRLALPVGLGTAGGPNSGEIGGVLENPYAALPSLHVAWAAWCAWAVWGQLTDPRRWWAWLYPAITAVVVIGTANHYLLDVLAGLVIWLFAVVI